ncbi:MAG: ATP-dependent Clp protease proteolytic subunit, partial [Rubrobacteraceae bacterium]
MKRFFVLFALCVAFMVGCGLGQAESGEKEVFVATIDGEINGQAADYVERVISEAEESEASAVAIELDTPGGALTSTERMIEAMTGADETPVIVHVPRGGAAISAGTFIVMASDVAAMAPGTRLGAASPVTMFGQDIPGTLGDKVTNDSVALITGLAENRGRNEEWAESAVREAASENAEDALEMGIVEHLEEDLESVLEAADGERVEPKGLTLDVADAALIQQSRTFGERFGIPLWAVVVPGVAVVLVLVGVTLA